MINVGDWIGQATTTTGEGPITLGAQLQGYTSFADHDPDSQFWYAILDGYNREVGIGSFVGPDQFTRDTIHATLIEGVYRGLSGGPVAIPLSGEAVIFSTFNEQAFDQLFAHLEDTDIHFSDAPVDGTPYSRQDKVWVPASSGGESNTSSNVGTGEGLAKLKDDIDLPFKSLIGGTNVTLDATDNEVTINASGGSGSTDHDDLTNVTPDQHHNQAHLLYGPDQTDVNSTGDPSLRDGLFFTGGQFALDRRMNWRSSWAAGTYEKEDVVRDGNWLAIANTQTTERPAPQATGEPYEPTSGATWPTGQQTDSVTVGNIYTAGIGFYCDAIGLSVAAGNVGLTHTYVVLVDDILKGTLSWIPESSGAAVLDIGGVIIPAGSTVEVRVTVVNDVGNNFLYWQQDVGYWGTYVLPDELADVQGIKDGGAPSDTAYAVDIRITPATISTEWDILATSGGSSGGGGGSFTPEVFSGIGTQGYVPDPEAGTLTRVLNADGGWVEPAGGTTPVQNKGDIYTHNGVADAALPLGIGQGHMLMVNNAADTGMEWQALPLPPQGYMSLNYDWNQATTSPPAAGEIRINTPDVVDATKVYIDNATSNGNDVHDFVNALQEGEFLTLWEQVSNHQTCIYQVQGVTDHTDWLEIDVSYVYSSPFTEYGTGYNMSVALVAAPGQLLPDGGTTGQTLVKASDTPFDTEWGAASGGVGFDPLWYRVPGDGIMVFSTGQSNCDLNLDTSSAPNDALLPIDEPFVKNDNVWELVNTNDSSITGVATAEWRVADLDKPDNGSPTSEEDKRATLGLSGEGRGNTAWALCNRLSEMFPDEIIYLVQTYRVGSRILWWEPNEPTAEMWEMNLAAMDRALELLPSRVNRFADIFDWRQGGGDALDGADPDHWGWYRDQWLAIVQDYEARGYLKPFYSTYFYSELAKGIQQMQDAQFHRYIDDATNEHTRIVSSTGYAVYDQLHFYGDDRMRLGRSIANSFMQSPSFQSYAPTAIFDVFEDETPVLGGDLDANGKIITNIDHMEIVGIPSYPSEEAYIPPPFINVTGPHDHNSVNGQLPTVVQLETVTTLNAVTLPLLGGSLFRNISTVKNATGVSLSTGPNLSFAAQPVFEADNAELSNGNFFGPIAWSDFLSSPILRPTGTGTFNVEMYIGYISNLILEGDANLRGRVGFNVNPFSDTGSLDNQIGFRSGLLTNATNSAAYVIDSDAVPPAGHWGLYQRSDSTVVNSIANLTLSDTAGYDQPRGLVTGTDGSLSANDFVQLNSAGELWLGAGVWPEAVEPEDRSLGLHLFPWGSGTVVLMASQRESSGFAADKALWAYGSQISVVAAEQDLILGANAASVRLQYNGTNGLSLTAAGAVTIHNLTGTGTRNVSVQANGQLIAGAAALSEVGTQWVEQIAEHFDENTVSTTDDQWTTIGTVTLASGEVKRGNFSVKAVRTDAKGKYTSEQPFVADHDGTLDVDLGDIEEVGVALLNARVQANGNNVEFQVKGRNGQSWDWTGVAFNRDF